MYLIEFIFRNKTMDLVVYSWLFLSLMVCNLQALMFHLEPNTKKCLKEEIHKDVLVKGEYEVILLL